MKNLLITLACAACLTANAQTKILTFADSLNKEYAYMDSTGKVTITNKEAAIKHIGSAITQLVIDKVQAQNEAQKWHEAYLRRESEVAALRKFLTDNNIPY